MLRRMSLGFIVARFVSCLGVAIIAVCLAQVAGRSVAISKSILYLEAQAGDTKEASFMMKNNEGQKLTIRIRLVDWEDTPDGRTLILPPDTVSRSCASWIQFDPQTLDLIPGQEQEIRVTMNAPASAAGTYWAAFLVDRPAEEGALLESGIRAKTRFLIKLYQTSLPAAMNGKITDVAVGGLNPLGVKLRFNNTGETLMQDVHATVTLQDRTGRVLGEVSSDPFSTLPGYAVDVCMSSSLYMQIPGVYLVTTVVDFDADYVVAGQVSLRIKPLSLSPIGTSKSPPRDLDGDGLYEDVNGDGHLTDDDVSLLTTHIDDTCITRNVRAFDYSNDGKITQDDVDLLQGMLTRQVPGSEG